MGNRAVVSFGQKPSDMGVYLHWNGGVESVLGFLKAANVLGLTERSDMQDTSYYLARFAQMAGNFFGGITSVGIGKLSELDTAGDNGHFVIDGRKIVKRLNRKEYLDSEVTDYEHLSADLVEYSERVFEGVLEKNVAEFLGGKYEVLGKALQEYAAKCVYTPGVSNYSNFETTVNGYLFKFLVMTTMYGDKKMATAYPHFDETTHPSYENPIGIEVRA